MLSDQKASWLHAPQNTVSTNAGNVTQKVLGCTPPTHHKHTCWQCDTAGGHCYAAGQPGGTGGPCSASHSWLAAWLHQNQAHGGILCRQLDTAGQLCLRAGPVQACRWGVPAVPARALLSAPLVLCCGALKFEVQQSSSCKACSSCPQVLLASSKGRSSPGQVPYAACAASFVCRPPHSQPSCCLQGALLSEFLAQPLHICSLTCALPVAASSGAHLRPQPHHSSGQEAPAIQQRSSQAAPAEPPHQQGDAAQQDSVMLRAATEALLRAVSGQCRVQAGRSSSLKPASTAVSKWAILCKRPRQQDPPDPCEAPCSSNSAVAFLCIHPVALPACLSCTSSRVDSCCPAASGLLHCLQGAPRGSTAAWSHPSGILFQLCICWTCLTCWQAWLWRPHRRGQCAQVGLQGQVCLLGCI